MQVRDIAEMVDRRPIIELTEEDFRIIFDSVNQMSMEELNQLDDKLAIGEEVDIDDEYGQHSATLATLMAVYQRKSKLIVEEIKRPSVDLWQLEEFIKSSYRRMWMLPDLIYHLEKEIQKVDKEGVDEIFLLGLHAMTGYVYASLASRHWL